MDTTASACEDVEPTGGPTDTSIRTWLREAKLHEADIESAAAALAAERITTLTELTDTVSVRELRPVVVSVLNQSLGSRLAARRLELAIAGLLESSAPAPPRPLLDAWGDQPVHRPPMAPCTAPNGLYTPYKRSTGEQARPGQCMVGCTGFPRFWGEMGAVLRRVFAFPSCTDRKLKRRGDAGEWNVSKRPMSRFDSDLQV